LGHRQVRGDNRQATIEPQQPLRPETNSKGLLQISSLFHPWDYSSLNHRVREEDLRKPSSEISGADDYQKHKSSGGDCVFHT
jgi:hypothetical protein